MEVVSIGDLFGQVGIQGVLRRLDTLCFGQTPLESLGPVKSQIHHLAWITRPVVDRRQATSTWLARLTNVCLLRPGSGNMRPPIPHLLLRQASVVPGLQDARH